MKYNFSIGLMSGNSFDLSDGSPSMGDDHVVITNNVPKRYINELFSPYEVITGELDKGRWIDNFKAGRINGLDLERWSRAFCGRVGIKSEYEFAESVCLYLADSDFVISVMMCSDLNTGAALIKSLSDVTTLNICMETADEKTAGFDLALALDAAAGAAAIIVWTYTTILNHELKFGFGLSPDHSAFKFKGAGGRKMHIPNEKMTAIMLPMICMDVFISYWLCRELFLSRFDIKGYIATKTGKSIKPNLTRK